MPILETFFRELEIHPKKDGLFFLRVNTDAPYKFLSERSEVRSGVALICSHLEDIHRAVGFCLY